MKTLEEKKERQKQYYINNREKIIEQGRERQKQYYINNREKLIEQSRIWLKKNPDRKRRINFNRKLKLKNINFTINGNFFSVEYYEMLSRQMSGCSICGKTIIENGKLLAVDHDHKTGKIRELLCTKCNLLIGLGNDDPELLKKAVDYLYKHKNII